MSLAPYSTECVGASAGSSIAAEVPPCWAGDLVNPDGLFFPLTKSKPHDRKVQMQQCLLQQWQVFHWRRVRAPRPDGSGSGCPPGGTSEIWDH